ncbi:hypothetical protein HYU12_02980 [Candidatus Woesearchaeota archaeon]|nr:hypothetical protein [Candidatus Woesearchaeota archaeon]
MTPQQQEEQLQKLAKTLVNSALCHSMPEALKRAREILKIPEEKKTEPENNGKLPNIEELEAVKDEPEQNLKELMEEDAERIYRQKKNNQS